MPYPTANQLNAQLHAQAQQLSMNQQMAQGQQLNMLNGGASSQEHSILHEKFVAVNSNAHSKHHYALDALGDFLSDVVCYPYKREVSLLFFHVWQGREISANIVRREDFTIELSVSLLKPYKQLDKIMPYLRIDDIEFAKLTMIFADVIAQRAQDHKNNQRDYAEELKRLQLNKSPLDKVSHQMWEIDNPYPGRVFHSQPEKSPLFDSYENKPGFWSRLFGAGGDM